MTILTEIGIATVFVCFAGCVVATGIGMVPLDGEGGVWIWFGVGPASWKNGYSELGTLSYGGTVGGGGDGGGIESVPGGGGIESVPGGGAEPSRNNGWCRILLWVSTPFLVEFRILVVAATTAHFGVKDIDNDIRIQIMMSSHGEEFFFSFNFLSYLWFLDFNLVFLDLGLCSCYS